MIDRVKAVNNPLTIIAIFAALAEVAGTVVLATADRTVQQVFVWFVMGFPVLLVVCFFITLNANPRVLYAPSDFQNDENFLKMLDGARAVAVEVEGLETHLKSLKSDIVNQTTKQLNSLGDAERAKLAQIVSEQIDSLQAIAKATGKSANSLVTTVEASLKERLLTYMSEHGGGWDVEDRFSKVTGIPSATVREAMEELCRQGLVTNIDPRSGRDWHLSHPRTKGA